MRILIIEPDRAERTLAEKILSAERHEVRVASDAESGLSCIDSFNPDVVLVEQHLPRVTGLEAAKRLRAADAAGHRYVIVTAAHGMRGDMTAAFAAGADDFLRKPFQKEELVARVDAPVRIRRWASRIVEGGFGEANDVTQLLAWREAAGSVSQELAALFGMGFAIEPAEEPLRNSSTIAMLPLSLSEDEKDLCIFLGLDERSAQQLGELMFFHTPCTGEETRDLAGEAVNAVGGAIKRALTAEGKTATTGLPRTPDRSSTASTTGIIARKEWMLVSTDGVRISLVLRLGNREPTLVAVAALREGMVLRNDVRTAGGGLLLTQGTRLTEAHLPRLMDALGARRLVEVAEADAA